ncbi:EAL domain-containing protein [uncultured Nostoc sp.]|uniref:EAL domain-containing protein n=1 Tax=uncultured Nostoc sp. TaxID=340711 RepID=UPI0035CBA417
MAILNNTRIRVLLVEDNEDDYIITRDLLADVQDTQFELEWVSTYETALETISRLQHDVYLLDYRLGVHNGLEILQQMLNSGSDAPIILLTGSSTRTIDIEAMQLGATDFLSKSEISGGQLERTLRYAVRQRQLYQQIKHQAQREQALNRIVHSIRNSLDLNTIFLTATYEIAELLQADLAGIVQYYPAQQLWRTISEHRRHLDLPETLGFEFLDVGSEIAVRLKQLEIVQFEDISTYENPLAQVYAQTFPGSWLLVPLHFGSTVWGNLWLVRDKQLFSWQDWEVELTCAIADQLAIAIQQSQLYQQAQLMEARFQTFMNCSSTVSFMKDEQGKYVYLNRPFEQLFQVQQSDLQGKTDFDWLPEETARQVYENDRQVLATGQGMEIVETVSTPDGCLHHWLVSKFPFTDPTGQRFVGGVAIDITQQKQLEQALFQEKELAQVTLQSIGDAVITTDAMGRIQYLNPVAEAIAGWSQAEVQGLPLFDVFRLVDEITRQPVPHPVEKALREGCIAKLVKNTVLVTRSGNDLPIDDSAAPIRARDGQIVGAVMVFQDVSHTRNLTHQLSWQASHDALTGLVNRREFENYLENALTIAKQYDQTHILCYLDLDNFKIVNDTCGHAAGDQLLRQVATLYQSEIRKTDILARLGGDEFGILLSQCPLDQAIRIANTLRDRVKAFRFVWQDKLFTIGVSIGIAIITADTTNIASVLIAADSACYAAKNNGRNRVHIYQTNDLNLARQQGEMQWVTRLTQALEENRFYLYYQSIVPTTPTPSSKRHYEVLLRLWDETGNLILPGAFIPAAERYNLMHLIDRWVVRTLFAALEQHCCSSCEHCSTENAYCGCIHAVNLSGASINDDEFIDFLREQFALHQIPPSRICFEITETVAIANLTKAVEFINDLRSLGCCFALDDFGSGMSSFAYLKNLPVDYLKIDGGFIKNIVDNPIDSVMVEAIHQIGQVMGIQTIAEFVENDAILEKVTTLGVSYAQGYGIAKPRPLVFIANC